MAATVAGEFGPYTLETAAGKVQAKRARWPAMTLLPLRHDLFYFDGNPSRRVTLERKGDKVIAITIGNSDGSEQRFSRTEK
jgi:hypothetical protein